MGKPEGALAVREEKTSGLAEAMLFRGTMSERKVRILFLNQYFPPDPAPTGVLMRELGDYLDHRGYEVEYQCAPQDYGAERHGKGRLRREIAALFWILWNGLRARRADVVFCGTSPPCLLVAAGGVALWHRARLVHWAMDLYPELARVLGEFRVQFIGDFLQRLMGWAYRRADLVVALDEDMAKHLQQYRVQAQVVRPWLLSELEPRPDLDLPHDSKIWVYSGNLGRAHEWETLLQAQSLLEQRGLPFRLRFQGGGGNWAAAQEKARELGLKQCDWLPYAEPERVRASLLECAVLVVTQQPGARGLLWPSKLALMRSLPRPLLWVGPEGAIAQELSVLPHAGVFKPGEAKAVAEWLTRAIYSGARPVPQVPERQQALAAWEALLGSLTQA